MISGIHCEKDAFGIARAINRTANQMKQGTFKISVRFDPYRDGTLEAIPIEETPFYSLLQEL